jgi:hypothetical protein
MVLVQNGCSPFPFLFVGWLLTIFLWDVIVYVKFFFGGLGG